MPRPGPQGEVTKTQLSASNQGSGYLSLLLQMNSTKLNHTKITWLYKAIKNNKILNSEFYEVPAKSITCSSPKNDCIDRLKRNSSSVLPIWQHPLKALFSLFTACFFIRKLVLPKGVRFSYIYERQSLPSDILSPHGRFISCGVIMFNKITMKQHETPTDDTLHFLRLTHCG